MMDSIASDSSFKTSTLLAAERRRDRRKVKH